MSVIKQSGDLVVSDLSDQPEDVSEDRTASAHDESKPEDLSAQAAKGDAPDAVVEEGQPGPEEVPTPESQSVEEDSRAPSEMDASAAPVESVETTEAADTVEEDAASAAGATEGEESPGVAEPEEAADVVEVAKAEDIEDEAEAVIEPAAQPEAVEAEAASEAVQSQPEPVGNADDADVIVEVEAEAEEIEEKSVKMDWYIIKVQSNREDTIRQTISRRVAIAGLDQYFGQIIVPVQEEKELKGGRERIVRKKLLPGYVVIQVEVNDETRLLIRETPGVGDFLGSGGVAIPLPPHEVERILQTEKDERETAPKLKISFKAGDPIKINEGLFANHEGTVETVDMSSGRVVVMINIFGRSTPVELEYWQIEVVYTDG